MSLSYGYEYMSDSDINMTEHRIFNLPNPELNSESVTTEYADTHYSGGSGSGAKGDTGDIGPQRLTGPQGPAGSQGSKGDGDKRRHNKRRQMTTRFKG